MKLNFFIALLTILSVSCQQSTNPPIKKADTTIATDTSAVIKNFKNKENVETNSFSEIDTSGILIFPLSLTQGDYDGGGNSIGDSYSSGERQASYWNIIFYNSKTKEYHLLNDEKKLLIWNYAFQNQVSGSSSGNESFTETNVKFANSFILYRVTENDYNNDKKLGTGDPAYLFVSDKAGNNFKQISPPDYDLLSYQYINASNKIVMIVKGDTNNNKKFEENDETFTFEIEMNKDAKPVEIFKANFKNTLKILYHKNWATK